MRRVILIAILFCIVVSFVSSAFAGRVRGYTRGDDTYVPSYYRSDPDSSPYNNRGYLESPNPQGYLDRYNRDKYGW